MKTKTYTLKCENYINFSGNSTQPTCPAPGQYMEPTDELGNELSAYEKTNKCLMTLSGNGEFCEFIGDSVIEAWDALRRYADDNINDFGCVSFDDLEPEAMIHIVYVYDRHVPLHVDVKQSNVGTMLKNVLPMCNNAYSRINDAIMREFGISY
jgi:hypothetical protein